MVWMKSVTAGPLETNCYLLGNEQSKHAILIDAPPGCFQEVTRILREADKSLSAVIITHAHFDHIIDLGYFCRQSIPVYAHPAGLELIRMPDGMGFIKEPDDGFLPGCINHFIDRPGNITIGDISLEVREVPGHCPGSLAFYFSVFAICFSGDSLFAGSVGRTDIKGANHEELVRSIKDQLYTLPDETIIFPGHGPQTTAGSEKRNNPFVRQGV